MHRDESDRLVTCLDCGTELAAGSDRDFEFGENGVLCWTCAERRGGSDDDAEARWVESPNLEGLGEIGYERD